MSVRNVTLSTGINTVTFNGNPNAYNDPGDAATPDTVITGTNGDDIIAGNSGVDMLWGGNGNDVLLGNLGNDTLNGGNGNDRLFGGQGNDTLNGGNQNDWLSGDQGSDTLTGGQGNDVFSFNVASRVLGTGIDTVTDFTPSGGQRDRLELRNGDISKVSVAVAGGNLEVFYDGVQIAVLNGVTETSISSLFQLV